MFNGGNITIGVSNMDRAVKFYTEVLGVKLVYRFGDHWASLQVGQTLTIGLHPGPVLPDSTHPGSMSIGFELSGPIEDAMRTLQARGVQFTSAVNSGKSGKFVSFRDPDGNPLYLAELNRAHVAQGEGSYPTA